MAKPPTDFPLPADLPRPVDDGAAQHLSGLAMPKIILPSTKGRSINLTALSAPRTVIYCYPMTGVPGKPLPEGWDMIPGARGCTPQTCSFRDHHEELAEMGAEVYGLSTQTTEYQQEMAERLREWLLFLATQSEPKVREFLIQREVPEEKLNAALKDARLLYERFGFAVAGVRPAYYSKPVEDALILWREDVTPERRP
jgi:peroxiredoxin